MPSKSPVSLEDIMNALKSIQQTQTAHTDMLNKLASGKKPTASSSNETTEANSKTTTRAPTIDALLKDVISDAKLNFKGCIEGTHSNQSIWPFKTDSDFIAKYKDDDKKFIPELKKKLNKDETAKLKALLANKENYSATTKVSKKKPKKEESSDSDSEPSKPKAKSKSKSKTKTDKKIKVDSDEEEEEDEDDTE